MPVRFAIALALFGVTEAATTQAQRIEFSEPGWELAGEHTRIDTVGGSTVLRARNGTARFGPVSLENGTIEFEMSVTPYRSFVYVNFRMQSNRDFEEIYFRPHKSRLPDAIQYSPVYGGVSNWQLYHGAGYTAPVALPRDEWIKVRLVLRGEQAALFVGDVAQPQLVIRQLARDPAAGYIGLRSFLVDPGAPDDAFGASFRNVVVRPDDVPFDFATVEAPPPPGAGVITQWRVSAPFVPDSGAIESLPAEVLASSSWRTLSTDQRGILVMGKYVTRPLGVQRPGVLARVSIIADRERLVRFNMGFSDDVSVFLNGRLLFYGNDSYSFDQPRRQGLIGLGQAALYLPLNAGRNELILAVTDVFGGWGLMGQLSDTEGLTVQPR